MEIIKGTQSTIYMNHSTKLVKKIATDRGKQDTIDQIIFYSNLSPDLAKFFPKILDSTNGPDEYSYTYKLIEYPNLRNLLLNGRFDDSWSNSLGFALNTISKTIHTYKTQSSNFDDVYNTYIKRCKNRIAETQKLMSTNYDLMDMNIILDKKIIHNPLLFFLDYFENNINRLLPPYICTTHGQLGPSHIFMSETSNDFILIDPKGFDHLYDPIIDFAKIGKAMLFATEWLEEEFYSLEYTIVGNNINIIDYQITNYNFSQMQREYDSILDKVATFDDEEVRFRNFALICADLIGGLPFAYVAGGEKRVVALLGQIAKASTFLQ